MTILASTPRQRAARPTGVPGRTMPAGSATVSAPTDSSVPNLTTPNLTTPDLTTPDPTTPDPTTPADRDGATAARQSGPGGVRLSWRPRHVLVLVAVTALVGLLAYANRDAIDLRLWREQLRPGWAALAFAGVGITLVGNALNLMGASPVRLRFWRTFAAQVAGSLVRIVSPAAVGAAAVNVQYLRRAGVGSAASIGTVSVAQTVQLLLALILLPPVAFAAGANLVVLNGNGAVIALAAVGGAVLLVVAGFVVVRRSALLEARVRVLLGELTRSVRAMATRPSRAAVSVAGAALISAGLITALWASVHAFGGTLGLLPVAGVLLLGSTAGNAIPVPGGLGSVDAALVAALTATGVGLGVALPAVALFRLVTLWLLLPAGLVSVGMLRRRGAL
ncbi:lysylphosphatidylglycerol synthase transmembrane domain-containing protein [Actinopolymorpha alba]|uniref:lysylphosphatidylglycerol synthase transmembrane domain-containing protein n=1 Tax=Actinopolymorpha alba TaxID=533267 RepID=UPI00037442FF|nr:lysylphosphatidylglycerol synthase transmembrane domain-containing protein [Actinopolymorpha alba]